MNLDNAAKQNLFLKICDAYSEGDPLKEVLGRYHITPRMFADWLKDPECRQLFNESSEAFLLFQDQNIRTKALQAFEKLVTGFDVEEVTEESVMLPDGSSKPTRHITKTKHFAPNVHAVILALQKLIPNVYSDPAKLLPQSPEEEEEQIFKIGNSEIKFK